MRRRWRRPAGARRERRRGRVEPKAAMGAEAGVASDAGRERSRSRRPGVEGGGLAECALSRRPQRKQAVANSEALGEEWADTGGDYEALGQRSASDFEQASEGRSSESGEADRGAALSASARAALGQALSGLRGAGPLTEEDRKQQRLAEAAEGMEAQRAPTALGARGSRMRAQHGLDVGLLADRRKAEVVDAARQFLVQERGREGRRCFRISHEDGEALWDAWSGPLGGRERAEGGRRARSLGAVLLAIQRRAGGAARPVGGEACADIEAELGEAFCKFHPLPCMRFECSMLQTAVEGADGVVSWRDVQCGAPRRGQVSGRRPRRF